MGQWYQGDLGYLTTIQLTSILKYLYRVNNKCKTILFANAF
jgi:hypothetical protein